MPAAKPPEFRRRAVELARLREKPIAQIAKDLGISESCLRRWMDQADVDAGRKEGLTSDERRELVELRRREPGAGDGDRDPQAGLGLLRPGERAPKIGFRLVHELAADGFDVAVACRVLEVSRSGYYEWRAAPRRRGRRRRLSGRRDPRRPRRVPRHLRRPAGARRAAPRAAGCGCGRKRVARLMRVAGLAGICHRRKRRHRPAPAVHDDLVKRRFVAEAPDRLWCTDITEHPTGEGGSTAAPSSTCSPAGSWAGRSPTTCAPSSSSTPCRWPAGTADRARHHRARRPRQPNTRPGSSATGCAKPACSARWAGSPLSVDNAMIESFWSTMQRELLDRQRLDHPGRAGLGDLRVDRRLVQPRPPAHQPRDTCPRRVRSPSHRRR